MLRRVALLAGLAALAGCTAKKRPAKQGRRPTAGKGPKTMGSLLLDSYIADLNTGSTESRITAAKELANMGPAAKAAVPALRRLAGHADAKLAAAAKAAIESIGR